MARWSYAMKFDLPTLEQYRFGLEEFGVYELGFVRNNVFFWKYIGKASDQTLYKRLRCYHQRSRADKIPPKLKDHIHLHRNLIWFHVFCAKDPCRTESLMLRRFGIGKDLGDYEWNRKYEPETADSRA